MKSIGFDLRVKWYFLKRIINVLNATHIITASHSSIPWYYCLNHIANWFSPYANYFYSMIYCVFQSLENTMSLRLSVNLQHSFLADVNNIVYRYFERACLSCPWMYTVRARFERLRSCLHFQFHQNCENLIQQYYYSTKCFSLKCCESTNTLYAICKKRKFKHRFETIVVISQTYKLVKGINFFTCRMQFIHLHVCIFCKTM